ncbi:MAG TPA: methyltransferase domain-containing protein [Gemmataceae bacterium]|jgi:ubiquinone/menaquinone biosynthesis C-methylase UbiE|nr:methyltransferase domain-containing protein [Gemmataceae bacterium]
MTSPADWQLPPGVSREVWQYLHDSTVARRYDESLAGTPLLDLDRRFVERHLHGHRRVIDLGCGTGRIAVPLAKSGHAVTAVDLSEEMLRVAEEKATAAGVRLDLVRANIVTLDGFSPQAYDAAICMFAALGMIAGADARRQVIANAFRLLMPGGLFLLHVHSRWHHLRTAAGRRWLIRDIFRTATGSAAAGDWQMEHHAGMTGWTMHLFTRGEITGILRSAGFEVIEVLPVGLTESGTLPRPRLFPGFRAYGFLIAARRPESTGEKSRPVLS